MEKHIYYQRVLELEVHFLPFYNQATKIFFFVEVYEYTIEHASERMSR